MKKLLISALIIALLIVASVCVIASFCFDTDASILVFLGERIAFAAVCICSYKIAEKLYKNRLAILTGNNR